MCLQGAGAGTRGHPGQLGEGSSGHSSRGGRLLPEPHNKPARFTFRFLVVPSFSCLLPHPARFQSSCFPSWAGGSEGLCLVGPEEMLSALNRRDGPPEEGAAAGLQGFAVDKTFLSSLKGILLETELVTAATPTCLLALAPLPFPPSPFPSFLDILPTPDCLSLTFFLPSCCLCIWRRFTAGFVCGRKDRS